MDKKEILSDSLKLLATDHSQSFLHTELMVSACCYCYRLLTCTHPVACDQEVIFLAANLLNCNHTGDDVVTSFISLCLHHSVHEVCECVLIEMKRKRLSVNIITPLKPILLAISISLSNSQLLTMVSWFEC